MLTGSTCQKDPTMRKTLFVFALFIAMAASATAETNYTFGEQSCVKISNCILYGPGEQYSLWTTAPSSSSLGWSILSTYDWSTGVAVTTATYNCNNGAYHSTPASGTGVVITVSCSGTSDNGTAFALSYQINAYSYHYSGGGGKGGGGAGTRWKITSATATLTTY